LSAEKNQWRSPTAERIYRDDPRIEVRSVGVSEKSRRRISADDLAWADLVMVMEQRYKSRITETFHDRERLPPIVSLDIPDEYEYMDGELIKLIHEGVEFHLRQELNLEPESGA